MSGSEDIEGCPLTVAGPDNVSCAALPSGQAVADLLDGKPAVPAVVGSMLGRAILIGIGIAAGRGLAGAPLKGTLRDGFAGAVGVEFFVVAWAFWRKRNMVKESAAK